MPGWNQLEVGCSLSSFLFRHFVRYHRKHPPKKNLQFTLHPELDRIHRKWMEGCTIHNRVVWYMVSLCLYALPTATLANAFNDLFDISLSPYSLHIELFDLLHQFGSPILQIFHYLTAEHSQNISTSNFRPTTRYFLETISWKMFGNLWRRSLERDRCSLADCSW